MNNILDKKYPNRFKYLDPEEKSDIDAYMQGEYVHAPDKNTLIQSLNTSLAAMRQEQKQQYNFRLKVQDIDTIKSYAKREGVPYQKVIGGLVSQFSRELEMMKK